MRKTPVISLAATTGLIGAISAGGGDPDQVLRSCGLSRREVSNPQGFVAYSIFARLLETAAQATSDACFGLHFGEHYNPKNAGPVTYLTLNSPTFAVGFEALARYLNAHNEGGRVAFAIEGERAYVRHEITDPSIESPRQPSEYSMAVGRNTIRLMAGSQWVPAEVQFAHPAPSDVTEHTRVFGAPVSFGCTANAFVIDRQFVDRQVPSADEYLYPVLKRYLDRVLAEMPREDDLLASIRRAVGESLRDGDPNLARVAGKIAMGERTLQRRLREQGVDFKGLVDDTRRRFSLNYLRERKHTLSDIACLLGYSEVSAFNRAFRRWTGSTPLDYRRQVVRGANRSIGSAPLQS
jgi:AraC-like DNA-binding protein